MKKALAYACMHAALGRDVNPSNLSSVELMVTPSFLLALGISLHLKKRGTALRTDVYTFGGSVAVASGR